MSTIIQEDGTIISPGANGMRLACSVAGCADPLCGCREMQVTAVPIDERVREVEQEGDRLRFRYDACEGEPEPARTAEALDVWVDVDTGEILPGREGEEVCGDDPRVVWLSAALDIRLLRHLAAKLLEVKGGSSREGEPRQRQPVWRVSNHDTVRWSELFHEDREDLYVHDDMVWAASDQYCSSPACPDCAVMMAFQAKDSRRSGVVRVRKGEAPVLEADRMSAKVLRALWRAYLRRHGDTRELLERRDKVKDACRRALASWRERPVEARKRLGRNDPCWCGSKKKYKKCHLAADQEGSGC